MRRPRPSYDYDQTAFTWLFLFVATAGIALAVWLAWLAVSTIWETVSDTLESRKPVDRFTLDIERAMRVESK